jgi:hypothetical protein
MAQNTARLSAVDPAHGWAASTLAETPKPRDAHTSAKLSKEARQNPWTLADFSLPISAGADKNV